MEEKTTDSQHVVIVGAGVAGCHAARNLAVDHDVTVFDRIGVAAEATGLSAGIVAPTLFYGDVPEIARHGNAFFREFDGTHDFTFTQRDRIDVVTDDVQAARSEAERLSDDGFPVTYLDATEMIERYEMFDFEQFVGAVLYRDTGWVDPYSYAIALHRSAADRGAQFELGVEVEDVVIDGDAVTGVQTDESFVPAAAAVVAVGWRTRDLLGEGFDVPIRPYRTQVSILRPESPLPETFPIGRIGCEHFYFRPEHNGDLLIGGGHETVADPIAASRDVDETFRLHVADFVPSLVPGLGELEFVNGWAGIDAASPDTRPIIDTPVSGPSNLLVATGFNGMGIMASPVVGPTVRQRLTGEPAGFSTKPFTADRFDDLEAEFEYVSTSDI